MNKEELILNMDRCINGIAQVDCEDCPYNNENFCRLFLMRDALNYIKEDNAQELKQQLALETAALHDATKRLAAYKKKLKEAEVEVAKKIFADIDAITSEYMNNEDYSMGDVIFAIDDLKEKYGVED
jgi:hypothetical protein